MVPAPASAAQHPSRVHVRSQRPRRLRSLFCCETPVAARCASCYRLAPSHLVFTGPMQLRATARFSVASPLAVKLRRRRSWRFHGRHRVRKLSSRVDVASRSHFGAAARSHVAVASLYFLGAAALIHAGCSHLRHRVWQRSSRVAVLFLLPVASLRLLGAVPAIQASLANAAIHVFALLRAQTHSPHQGTSLGTFMCGLIS